jgi:hypothetical protein
VAASYAIVVYRGAPAASALLPVTNTRGPSGLTATELAWSSPVPGPWSKTVHSTAPVAALKARVVYRRRPALLALLPVTNTRDPSGLTAR